MGLRRDKMLVSRLPWPPNPQQVILTVNSTLQSNFTLALVMDDNTFFALYWCCSLSYSTELQCSGNQICSNYSLNHTKKKCVLREADPVIQDSCQPFFTMGLDRLDIFNPINKWVASPYMLLDHPFGSNPTW